MNRRGFLQSGLILLGAPAIVRAESLMKIWVPPYQCRITGHRTWRESVFPEFNGWYEYEIHALWDADDRGVHTSMQCGIRFGSKGGNIEHMTDSLNWNWKRLNQPIRVSQQQVREAFNATH